jgi:hypothetical protein
MKISTVFHTSSELLAGGGTLGSESTVPQRETVVPLFV